LRAPIVDALRALFLVVALRMFHVGAAGGGGGGGSSSSE